MAESSGASVDADRARALERLHQLTADGVLSADESADRERRVELAITRAGIAQVFVGLPEPANSQQISGANGTSSNGGWAPLDPEPAQASVPLPPRPAPPKPAPAQAAPSNGASAGPSQTAEQPPKRPRMPPISAGSRRLRTAALKPTASTMPPIAAGSRRRPAQSARSVHGPWWDIFGPRLVLGLKFVGVMFMAGLAFSTLGPVMNLDGSNDAEPAGSGRATPEPATEATVMPPGASGSPPSTVRSRPVSVRSGREELVVLQVGVDIEPGRYIAGPGSDDCYWERVSATTGSEDEIIVNAKLPSDHVVVEVGPTDAGLASQGCGQWRLYQPIPTLIDTVGDGDWLVGTDIEPGTYSTPNDGSNRLACHWERASGFTHAYSEVIARDNPGTKAATVELLDGERFSTNDCGTWTKP